MRLARTRHSGLAAGVVVVVVVLSALLPQAAAHAATPKPTVYPLGTPVAGLSAATQMVEAKGHLFVSNATASDVKVLSTAGKVLANLPGLAGASGLVASPDGKDVYVALSGSDKIGLIDTTSLQEVGSFPVDSCPTSLALASGRLFYSFGCPDSPSGTDGVSSIDPNSGGPLKVAVAGLSNPALIRAHGNELAVFDRIETVTTYVATDDGTVLPATKAPSATIPNIEDMTFTSDSKNLLVATTSPARITSLAAATMTPNSVTYPGVSFPQAVAADPKGRYVAAGFRSKTTTAEMYAQSSGTPRWARFTAGSDPSKWVSGRSDDAIEPQTLTFSPTGTDVFGLVKRAGIKGLFLFDSAISPTASKVSVTVPHVGFGARPTATSRGPAGVLVEFLLTDAGRTTSLGTVPANTAGVAKTSFLPKYSGTVTAVVLGDRASLPAKAAASFRVASFTAYRLLGKHRNEHGVAVYSSYRKIKVAFTTAPAETRRAAVSRIQRHVHGHWRTTQTVHGFERYRGVSVVFKSAPKHVELRVRLSVPADADSGASSATSQPFQIS